MKKKLMTAAIAAAGAGAAALAARLRKVRKEIAIRQAASSYPVQEGEEAAGREVKEGSGSDGL